MWRSVVVGGGTRRGNPVGRKAAVDASDNGPTLQYEIPVNTKIPFFDLISRTAWYFQYTREGRVFPNSAWKTKERRKEGRNTKEHEGRKEGREEGRKEHEESEEGKRRKTGTKTNAARKGGRNK
jgi:hypothetical protein